MDDIKEKIKQALRHIWTNKYRLFLCLLTLCCLFGLVHYFKSADSATASISFNYSEAALGMNPNKTRFNAYEIVSDEVMERAIRRVGLQDSLTASQLAQCLYLSPEGTGSANGSEYISTNYYLSINTRKLNLGNRKPTDLLQSVCESYREWAGFVNVAKCVEEGAGEDETDTGDSEKGSDPVLFQNPVDCAAGGNNLRSDL